MIVWSHHTGPIARPNIVRKVHGWWVTVAHFRKGMERKKEEKRKGGTHHHPPTSTGERERELVKMCIQVC